MKREWTKLSELGCLKMFTRQVAIHFRATDAYDWTLAHELFFEEGTLWVESYFHISMDAATYHPYFDQVELYEMKVYTENNGEQLFFNEEDTKTLEEQIDAIMEQLGGFEALMHLNVHVDVDKIKKQNYTIEVYPSEGSDQIYAQIEVAGISAPMFVFLDPEEAIATKTYDLGIADDTDEFEMMLVDARDYLSEHVYQYVSNFINEPLHQTFVNYVQNSH